MSKKKLAIKLLNDTKQNCLIYIPIYKKDKNKSMLKMYKERLVIVEYLLGLCEKNGRS